MNYVIYTDGSDLKHTTHRMGVGGVLLKDGQLIDSFGYELGHDYLKDHFGTTDCSNPTAEMVAARVALELWGSKFNPGDKVELKADYIGVREWMTGKWKINKGYIRKVYQEIKDLEKESGVSITWTWIKGHQTGPSLYGTDKYWNDEVDKLAKSGR